MRPGDLRVHARGFKPGDLLVEFARVIDLRVDRSHYVRGIDRLHDIGEDKAAACGELPGDLPEQIGLACAYEVMYCKTR